MNFEINFRPERYVVLAYLIEKGERHSHGQDIKAIYEQRQETLDIVLARNLLDAKSSASDILNGIHNPVHEQDSIIIAIAYDVIPPRSHGGD